MPLVTQYKSAPHLDEKASRCSVRMEGLFLLLVVVMFVFLLLVQPLCPCSWRLIQPLMAAAANHAHWLDGMLLLLLVEANRLPAAHRALRAADRQDQTQQQLLHCQLHDLLVLVELVGCPGPCLMKGTELAGRQQSVNGCAPRTCMR